MDSRDSGSPIRGGISTSYSANLASPNPSGSSLGRSVRRATPAEQLKELKRGTLEVLPEDELLKKLENSYETGKPLIVKFGADPSRPDLHLGHTVVINKLKALQDFGHEIHFLIGDFTAQIGDPTGRSKTRQQLSESEVKANSLTYQEQIFKILDPAQTRIVYNSAWLNPVQLSQFLQILMSTTLVQLLSREDFTTRFKAEQPIYMHEFLYPILQGWDSVVMKADIELGGNDQKFNLLMGRHLQKCFHAPQQALIIMPLLEGLDGVNKMSKSFENTVSLTESSKDMFGKIMSISDELMIRYYELLSSLTVDEVQALKNGILSGQVHPMEAKKRLGQEIVDRYHGSGVGAQERQRFEDLFSKKTLTSDLPWVQASLEKSGDQAGKLDLVQLMVTQGFTKSKSEARRLLKQKAVKVDQAGVEQEFISVLPNSEFVLKVGKLHLVRVKVSDQ